jgi:ribosomal protein S18 acetylase RimI-like enzyme
MSASPEHLPAPHVLDNPIWQSLSTSHQSFAEGNTLAKRYVPDVAPLAGIDRQSPDTYEALWDVVGPGGAAALFLNEAPKVPPGWSLARTFDVHQMIYVVPGDLREGRNFELLSEQDVPQMLALTQLTEPGPFRKRTIELGTYLGIFSPERKLIAMSGERLRVPGFTEISAVCTHPDHRGKGYARSLMSTLIKQIKDRGEIPFLHVKGDNVGAIRLYESLGFHFRICFNLAVVTCTT